MKGMFFGRKPKKEGLDDLRGREKKLYDKLAAAMLLIGGRSSNGISLEEALQHAKDCEERERVNQAAAWRKISLRRALFSGQREVLEECLRKYEALTGQRLLESGEINEALQFVQKYYPS